MTYYYNEFNIVLSQNSSTGKKLQNLNKLSVDITSNLNYNLLKYIVTNNDWKSRQGM